jgi:hypothetical protein
MAPTTPPATGISTGRLLMRPPPPPRATKRCVGQSWMAVMAAPVAGNHDAVQAGRGGVLASPILDHGPSAPEPLQHPQDVAARARRLRHRLPECPSSTALLVRRAARPVERLEEAVGMERRLKEKEHLSAGAEQGSHRRAQPDAGQPQPGGRGPIPKLGHGVPGGPFHPPEGRRRRIPGAVTLPRPVKHQPGPSQEGHASSQPVARVQGVAELPAPGGTGHQPEPGLGARVQRPVQGVTSRGEIEGLPPQALVCQHGRVGQGSQGTWRI